MIKELIYNVIFPTGRRLNNSLKFEKGLTEITGANEAGKSFIIEMIRFSLYGTAALRGKVDDYKTLRTEMSFALRGEAYFVERSISTATLCNEAKATLATGVRPVNQKLRELLGFDLQVFDVACVANQGDIERLGSLPPAERKRLVDEVVGLDRIDLVLKAVSDETALLRRELEVEERQIGSEPVLPLLAGGVGSIAEITQELATAEEATREVNQLQGWLSASLRAPVLAVRPPGLASTEELRAQHAEDAAWQEQVRQINQLIVVDFDPVSVAEQWAAYDIYQQQQAFFVRIGLRPELSVEEIDEGTKAHLNLEHRKDLEVRRAKAQHNMIDCPNCKHSFAMGHEVIDLIDAELARYPYVEPKWTREVLRREQTRTLNWASSDVQQQYLAMKDIPPSEKPSVSREALGKAYAPGVVHKRPEIPIRKYDPRKLVAELAESNAFDAAEAFYKTACETYNAWLSQKVVKELSLARAKEVAAPLSELRMTLATRQTFERNFMVAEKARRAWLECATRIVGLKQGLEDWKQARLFLADVREQIKSHLVPSLSRVASHLLAQMTEGKRRNIKVDENFEVMVDGQSLSTLSGSGKACANLALRIGLGRVLTNNVFPVFIGDEMDASMDASRASNTLLSLRGLVDSISQILVISHKSPTSNQTISV